MTTPPDASPPDLDRSMQSGGVNLGHGNKVNIGGDVVGGDKHVHVSDDASHDVRGLPNPYLGLRCFTYDDRAAYAGREREIAATVAQLTEPGIEVNLLFVTGASGSGKSSFAQAGLLPALETHYAKRGWQVRSALFTPAQRPMARLKDALAHVAGSDLVGCRDAMHRVSTSVTILIIEQFEELFTQSDRAERDALLAWLQALPPFERGRMHVIVTIRSDYLNELHGVQPLWDAAMRHRAELRAMNVDELNAAIQRPLQARFPDGAKRFEPALVDVLAKEASESATFLPLLQVTLEEIWKTGGLERTSYGTLTDAIRQRADQVHEFVDYDDPHPHQLRSDAACAAVMGIFLDLVNVSLDDDDRRDVRISRAKDDLATGGRGALIDDLARARLLSVTKDGEAETVNIIHETLIGNWARLRDAVRARRQQLQQRARFEQQVADWLDHSKSDDYLLTGVYLAQARELERVGDIALQGREAKDLLRRSAETAEAGQRRQLEAQKQRADEQAQTAKRLRYMLTALVAALVGLGVFIFALISANKTAQEETERAEKQSSLASARQLSSQAILAVDRGWDAELGLLLAVEAGKALKKSGQSVNNQVDEAFRRTIDSSPISIHRLDDAKIAIDPVNEEPSDSVVDRFG